MNIIFSSASNSTSTITILTSNQSLESYTLPANEKQLVVPLSLLAANNNTISITSPLTPSALNITVPPSTFYHSTDFALFGDSSLTTCFAGLCAPVGSKITNLSPIGSAKISISSTSSTSSSPSALTLSSKFVNIYFCNNDITFDNGTNTRNLTLQLNYQEPVRVELPLSGRSSELFSPYGWEDTGVFGVLLEGWLDGANDLVVGNAYGSEGVQSYGADLVGVEVFW
jgi:alpha-galactosidase